MTLAASVIADDRIMLIADCRVSFPDGQRHDALQKVYPIGTHALVAFSGSVGLASSSLREVLGTNRRFSRSKLDVFTRKLCRVANRKAAHRRRTKGPTGTQCSFIVAGYVGRQPYVAEIIVSGDRTPILRVYQSSGDCAVIGSGQAERDICRNTLTRNGLEKFSDDQAVMALGSSIDGGLSLVAFPQRFDEGIGSLKLSFVLKPEGARFVPMHMEMFRGRIADRNKPLGYAPVHSVVWVDSKRRFELFEHQSGSSYPLAGVLAPSRLQLDYDLRGVVREEFDPYSLKA